MQKLSENKDLLENAIVSSKHLQKKEVIHLFLHLIVRVKCVSTCCKNLICKCDGLTRHSSSQIDYTVCQFKTYYINIFSTFINWLFYYFSEKGVIIGVEKEGAGGGLKPPQLYSRRGLALPTFGR